jgi:iron complex outermembrane receptor protein
LATVSTQSDSADYGLFGFNPAWGGPNILGRYFRLGAKVDF